MHIYKIHDTLWRVSNDGKVKDVNVEFGKIKEPTNPYNILTETEKSLIETELLKNN